MGLGDTLMKIVVKVTDAVALAKRFEASPREALREVVQQVREGVRHTLEEVMEAGIELFLGQDAEKGNKRNGFTTRTFGIKGVGAVELRVPRDRAGRRIVPIVARWPSLAAAVALVVSADARPCAAQEIVLKGPLAPSCIAIRARYRVPARLEWACWLSSGVAIEGVGDRVRRTSAFAAGGAEATAGVVQYVGCPAPAASPEARLHPRPSWRSSVYAELRAGPWVQAMTRAEGALVEGGMTLHLGTVDDHVNTLFYTAPWGMWDVRVGGGYGAFRGGTSPEIALSLGWGYRFVLDRTTSGGACDPPPEPDRVADANLVRLVATIRHATSLPAWEA